MLTTSLLTEWQVYRMIDVQPAWAAFQYLVRERLRDEGVEVAPDGSLGWRRARRREAIAARRLRQDAPSCGARTAGRIVSSTYERSGRKRSTAGDAPVLDPEQRPLVELSLAQLSRSVASTQLERSAGRGEEEPLAAGADPERPADGAGEKRVEAFALVEPGGRHRAVQLLERLRAALGVLGEREDRLGVDGHLGMGALEAVVGEDLLVVDDDPVVDPDDRAVPDRVVVRLDRGMALGVVPHVHEHLRRRPAGTCTSLQQLTGAGAALVHRHGAARAAMGVPDGVGAALCDSRPGAPVQRASA